METFFIGTLARRGQVSRKQISSFRLLSERAAVRAEMATASRNDLFRHGALPREACAAVNNSSDFEHTRLRGQAMPPGLNVQAAARGSKRSREIATEAHCEQAALED